MSPTDATSTLPTGAPTGLLIDGTWTTAARQLRVEDPATLATLAEVGDAEVADGLAAVDAAYAAFDPWAHRPARERAEVLRRAFEIMTDEIEDCARLIVLENGKAWADAIGEARYAAEFFRWFAEEAVRVAGGFREAPAGDKMIITDHTPIGVAYLITPWNFPAAMATRKLAPALAAGCTAVLKPAAQTPLTALWVGEVLRRAGAPNGTVNIVTTSDPGSVSEAILADERVRTLSFTGSTPVGKVLLEQTAKRVLVSSMELGGNAPFLVLEGADVDAAVEGAMLAKMRNGGAACTAANRFYVHASLVGDFTARFREALASLKVGPGIDRGNDLGAMVSTHERDKILELLGQAEDDGGRPDAISATPDGGAFVAPHLVHDVTHGSTLTRTEVFGPVAPIVTFEDTDDAVRMANDTEFGLMAYVYGPDKGTGIAVARRMDAGMVGIDRGLLSDAAAPFGGMKESGLGREGGFHGIHEFLETRYLGVSL
ncbi:MAG: NAD-dependent succinate-semialdehyde dehydrogenase [Nitriliruptoraceae bacterium]|nr:NAD-dependent succinate-semialdehyde dehydrogenase [Nitriliruptoraceae bacterium]